MWKIRVQIAVRPISFRWYVVTFFSLTWWLVPELWEEVKADGKTNGPWNPIMLRTPPAFLLG
jgi:hypothetical protein